MTSLKLPAELGIQQNVILASHTSWLVGGPAEYFCEPQTVKGLQDVFVWAKNSKLQCSVLGGGTNVLVADSGVQGLVISLGKLSGIEIVDDTKSLSFWAKAGTSKSELLKLFLKYKLAPAKFLAGLPGQVGGGVVMNAGVSEKLVPREFVEIVEAIEVLRPDGRLEVLKAKDLTWDYRHCEGWKPGVITLVKCVWPLEPDLSILEEVRSLNQLRIKKQPLEWPSCGSVFRNPGPESAGSLIEKAGLKGHVLGGAQVSDKHANFIVNKGGAKASDIKALMDLCVGKVKDKFHVELKSEVVFLE